MLVVRQFREADAPALMALHDLALREVGARVGNGAWDADLSMIADAYLAAGGDFLVGEVDGALVAMGALRRVSSSSAEVKRMRVHPRWQGHGFGRELLERLEERARELGFSALRLDTTVQQHAARTLYERAGYRMVGTGQEHGFTVVRYEKRLA